MEFYLRDGVYYWQVVQILDHFDDTFELSLGGCPRFYLVEWKDGQRTYQHLTDLLPYAMGAIYEYEHRSELRSWGLTELTGASKIDSGTVESIWPQNMGRSKTLERSLSAFKLSSCHGISSSTASLEGLKLERIRAKTTSSDSTSTLESSYIPRTPEGQSSTTSNCPSFSRVKRREELEAITCPDEILSPVSEDGRNTTPKRRRSARKTIWPLNLGSRLESTRTSSSSEENL